ncbi:hypothetical protein ABLE93_15305 [Xanthobacter sp. KR7-65]|uniref:hypothetical protein n=1 Tax=Xanthobacter sp. KR7-65 TaxID=3156612 RepID=UPI0032B5BCA2
MQDRLGKDRFRGDRLSSRISRPSGGDRLLRRAALVLGVLAGGASAAAAQTTVAVPGGYVTFTPAQRQYIETYVVRHPVPPALVPGGFVAAVGEVVPPGVALRRFGPPQPVYGAAPYDPAYGPGYGRPAYGPGYATAGYDPDDRVPADESEAEAYGGDYGVGGYRYVVLPSQETAVVEPRSRRIILIVE